MGEDISRQTIIILVILTVIISLLGTWTIMTEVNRVSLARERSASANVMLTIISPENQSAKENEKIATTGMFSFTVISPPQ